jgi:hypothetical protein
VAQRQKRAQHNNPETEQPFIGLSTTEPRRVVDRRGFVLAGMVELPSFGTALSRWRPERPNCRCMRAYLISPIRILYYSMLIASLGAAGCGTFVAAAQAGGSAAILPMIDASVAHRDDNLLSYTVTEHYKVYRGADHVHPAAEMTVRTLYRKDSGKTFTILSQSGSHLLLSEVLGHVLDSETLMTQPANRSRVVLTSANYAMTAHGVDKVNGADCVRISIVPKTSSPYLFKGTIWVNGKDGDIVKLDGVTSKSVSMLTAATQVSRVYGEVDGMPMATHATAESNSWLLGATTIDIDYNGYQLTLRTTTATAEGQGDSAHPK